jgi:hypothetical protein
MKDRKVDRSMSIGTATVFSLLAVLPIMLFLVILYSTVWSVASFLAGLDRFFEWRSILPVLLIGVPVHEVLHAFAWLWFGKVPKESIKFGVKALTPYTHCVAPMPAGAYRVGALMPGFILGIIPYFVGLVFESGWFATSGLFYIFAAGGDLLILWILRGVDARRMVEDHPSRVGCYVYE